MEIKTFSQKPKWSKQAWSGRPFNRFLGNKALMEPTMCINYENKTKVDSTLTRQQWGNHQPPTHTSHKNSKLERKRERKKKRTTNQTSLSFSITFASGSMFRSYRVLTEKAFTETLSVFHGISIFALHWWRTLPMCDSKDEGIPWGSRNEKLKRCVPGGSSDSVVPVQEKKL